jgi:hypothetical protein
VRSRLAGAADPAHPSGANDGGDFIGSKTR